VAAVVALPAAAGAVVAGENGRIVMASGRTDTDATARLHLLPVFSNSIGGGTVGSPFVPAGGQWRHPSWSPDRTRIVAANGNATGDPTTEHFELFLFDFTNNSLSPLDLAATLDNLSDDRPAWSPDGTRIVFEHQPTAGSAERDIYIKTIGTAAPATPLTTGAPVEKWPSWSPDSQAVYYAKELGSPQFRDIVRKPAAGGAETPIQAASGLAEFQPSISPDGTKMCFTAQSDPDPVNPPDANQNTAGADVFVTSANGGGSLTPIATTTNVAEYNCTWSPDGELIAYVEGAFSTGRLVMRRADGTSAAAIELAQDANGNRFDGNPDWAPDGRPDCPDSTVSVLNNTTTTIPMECADTGPEYERTPVREAPLTQPTHGKLGDFQIGDPSTVPYTPDPGFTGTDTFTFRGFDDFGFGSDTGTVTITVVAPAGGGGGPGGGGPGGGGPGPTPTCAGKPATIVGSARADSLTGTSGPDVIVGLAGNDKINGAGGNDLICGGDGDDSLVGGAGNDRADGGAGNDRISGQSGNDRLNGQNGNDRLLGSAGRDTLSGGNGNDRLNGGPGRDRLSGGAGRDQLNGGADKDSCAGGAGRDRGTACEKRSSL